jgi:hypothetical protein
LACGRERGRQILFVGVVLYFFGLHLIRFECSIIYYYYYLNSIYKIYTSHLFTHQTINKSSCCNDVMWLLC